MTMCPVTVACLRESFSPYFTLYICNRWKDLNYIFLFFLRPKALEKIKIVLSRLIVKFSRSHTIGHKYPVRLL